MLEPTVAKRLRLIGFDVDGVLTDNGLWVGSVEGQQVELVRFDIQDGVGIKLLRLAGLKVVVVTGRVSKATEHRARDLGVDQIHQDARARKLRGFEEVLERQQVRWEQSAFVGDDLADLPVLRRVAVPLAVANAVPEVRDIALHVTERGGGTGAVRELAELVLKARGDWQATVASYLTERGEVAVRSSRVVSGGGSG